MARGHTFRTAAEAEAAAREALRTAKEILEVTGACASVGQRKRILDALKDVVALTEKAKMLHLKEQARERTALQGASDRAGSFGGGDTDPVDVPEPPHAS